MREILKIDGNNIRDKSNSRIGSLEGGVVRDKNHNRILTIENQKFKDKNNITIAEIKQSYLCDKSGKKIISLDEINDNIAGLSETDKAAVWLAFLR